MARVQRQLGVAHGQHVGRPQDAPQAVQGVVEQVAQGAVVRVVAGGQRRGRHPALFLVELAHALDVPGEMAFGKEFYAGDKVARRFMKIDKLSTAMGTEDGKPRPYRFGYGVLDANLNMIADSNEKKVYFEISDYAGNYIFFENPN